jgi:hypothetical protein
MPFQSISRDSLELLKQNYRSPGVLPGAVPPNKGDATAPQDLTFKVADEFIEVFPFVDISNGESQPHARQYQVRVAGNLSEPNFAAAPGGSPWKAGNTTPFGQDLEIVGARFKKLEVTVRSDDLMSDSGSLEDILSVEVDLAREAIKRSVSLSVLSSKPSSDDQSELAGLPFFLTASQDVAYDPARKLIGGLSEAIARCVTNDGRCDILVMSSRSSWRLDKEREDKGTGTEYLFCPLTGRIQQHFHGVPVLIGRVPEPAGTTPTTFAWALKIFGRSGVKILHNAGDAFGVRTRDLATMVEVDGTTGEAKSSSQGISVFGIYSLLVPEPTAIARLKGIPSPDPFTAP